MDYLQELKTEYRNTIFVNSLRFMDFHAANYKSDLTVIGSNHIPYDQVYIIDIEGVLNIYPIYDFGAQNE